MKTVSLLVSIAMFSGCGISMKHSIPNRDERLKEFLDEQIKHSEFPGIQYIVIDSTQRIFEYSGGWADIERRIPMQPSTTMMAYSMTKTFTAAAVLQLIGQRKLSLDDSVHALLPFTPYGHAMTVRHLLSQTSGIPNPIPLRWVHPADRHNSFDENAALNNVLKENPEPKFPPGDKYEYSNISYWLLGKIIEKVSGVTYAQYMQDHIFTPLGLSGNDPGYTIADRSHHAKGYLAKYSFMNLIKSFMIDKELIGEYEDGWLHINDHHLNGPAFGGLIGSAEHLALFLQDQLREQSVLFDAETKKLFYTQQKTNSGEPIEMTLGWHIGNLGGVKYFHKEGGGGGYHCQMRIYPERHIATIIMVNETSSKCVDVMSTLDKEFVF